VGSSCRKNNHLALLDRARLSRNRDFGSPFKDVQECVVGGGVLAKALTFVEGENGYSSFSVTDDRPADYRSLPYTAKRDKTSFWPGISPLEGPMRFSSIFVS